MEMSVTIIGSVSEVFQSDMWDPPVSLFLISDFRMDSYWKLLFLIVTLLFISSCSGNDNDDSEGAVVLVEDQGELLLTILLLHVLINLRNSFSVQTAEAVPSEESFLDPNAEKFIPTSEWQSVAKGQ